MMNPETLRILAYGWLLHHGTPPLVAEIARHFAVGVGTARTALAELKIGKTILVHPATGEIWMAGPFAAVPTQYRVTGSSSGTTWWANCAWDMLGIGMIANEPVNIVATCSDCGEDIHLAGYPDREPEGEGIVHFLVPAARWYDDIGFT